MIDNLLNILANMIVNNSIVAPILVLIAGLLTSLTPCSLSSIPLIIGYMNIIVGNETNDKRKMFKVSIIFALGQILTFSILAVMTALLGRIMQNAGGLWYIFLGSLMLLMALQVLEVINVVNPIVIQSNKKGYFGAFVTGMIGGVFSSPCATPILIVLISLISNTENLLWGIFLMVLYAIGVNVLTVLAGVSTGIVNKILKSNNYGKFSMFLKYFIGIFILLIGFYMFYLGF